MNRRLFLQLGAYAAAANLIAWQPLGQCASRAKPGEYDAVVVGAGLGGLCCAAHLARHGLKPVVLEQHHVPGGYATSFARQANGQDYTCEVSLESTSLDSPAAKKILTGLGVLGQLKPVAHHLAWAARFPDFNLDIPAKPGLSGFKKILTDMFPQEARGLDGYFGLWRGVLAEIQDLDQGLGWWLKPAFPWMYKSLWSIRDKTLGQILDQYLGDAKLKAVLAQTWGYFGLPPSKLSAFYYLLPVGQYLEHGGDYLEGTSQALSDALAQVITTQGGEVRLNTRVQSIILENNRAVGVKTVSGQDFRGQAVVCNASVPQLAEKLLPPGALPKAFTTRLQTAKPSLSTFIVWLGLNKDITKDLPQASLSFYPSLDPDQQYQACLKGDLDNAGFGVVVYDNLVPGFSPPGRSSMTILSLCGYEPWRTFEADYLAGRKEAYQAEKNRLTRLMIAQAERLALPGLSNLIEMVDSATPLTNLRYTGNSGGAIYGFDQTPDNSFMTRLPNKTGIDGLFLASAWGNPGGGFAGALLGGKNAFKDLLESWG